MLKTMRRSRVHDYVIPGLTSSLIGGEGCGMVRMFSQEREHEEPITPHSHRFDFQCLVLAGIVHNRIWYQGQYGDEYQATELEHHGMFGDQTRELTKEISKWSFKQSIYKKGDVYSMKAEDIHSIYFSKGAEVLFFEGPSKQSVSTILEPVSGGRVIPTFKVEKWMFRKED